MDPLVEHCDAIIEKLRETAPTALHDAEPEAIHDARVATRRMRAALRLIRPLISDEHRKPLARALRKLRRRLGEARDLDVMLDHLKSLGRARSHAAAIEWLMARLTECRHALRHDLSDDGAASRTLAKLGTWWGVREQISDRRDEVDARLGQSLIEQLNAFTDCANELKSSTERTSDPHALRIAGKSLRYTLEMAQSAGHPIDKKILKIFKKMQDALGLWHDYVVLAERAMQESADAMLAHHDANLQQKVLSLTNLILRRSETQLRRFAELWNAHGQEVQNAIHAAFPAPQPAIVTAPQTDRDPSGSNESAIPAAPRQDDHAAV
jgi:CHAD domain-containing protein